MSIIIRQQEYKSLFYNIYKSELIKQTNFNSDNIDTVYIARNLDKKKEFDNKNKKKVFNTNLKNKIIASDKISIFDKSNIAN